MRQTLEPIATGGRIGDLDELRGFALAGIGVVNALLIFEPLADTALGHTVWNRPVDDATRAAVDLLFTAKFYTLFAFLFGVGAALQRRRCVERGTAFVPFFLRRMAGLAAFGALHVVFVWFGDILLTYAVCGVVLALASLLPQGWRRFGTGLLFLAPLVMTTGLAALLGLAALTPEGAEMLAQFRAEQAASMTTLRDEALAVYGNAAFLETVGVRLAEYVLVASSLLLVLPAILATMLLGFEFGAAGFFDDLAARRRTMRRALPALLAVGLALNALGAYAQSATDPLSVDGWTIAFMAMLTIGAPALSASYAIGVARSRLGRVLAPAGRLALTHYLGQTLAMTALAYGWGAGLFGRVPPALSVSIALAIFGLQVAVSPFWLARFHMGPAEWLWRALTYGRRPPFRRVIR